MQLNNVYLKMEANMLFGALKFVRVHLEALTDFVNELKQHALEKIYHFLDPNVIDDFATALPDALKVLHRQTVHMAKTLSQAIKSIKKDIWHYKIILTEFMAIVRTSFRELSHFLHQFRAYRELFQFYYDYQSWFEELHFSQHVERSLSEIER